MFISSNTPLTIIGEKKSYKIPKKYLKNTNSIVYQGKIIGDKANIISLLIPVSDFNISSKSKSKNILVQIYLDKKRNTHQYFKQFSTAAIKNEKNIDLIDRYYHFIEKTGKSISDIYTTFNPKNVANETEETTEKDFIIRSERSTTFQIGDKETITRPRCSYELLQDGIYMNFNFPSDVCTIDNYQKIKSKQEKLLESWIFSLEE